MKHRLVVRAALICAAYFALTAGIELLARRYSASTAPGLCQTPALTLGLLVLCGLGYVPAAFAALLFNALIEVHPSSGIWLTLAVAAASAAAYAGVAWSVRRKFGPAPVPLNIRQAIALAVAAVAAPAVSAVGFAALIGPPALDAFLKSAVLRWVGGVAGILTVVPVIAVHLGPRLGAARRRLAATPKRGWIELTAQSAAVLAAMVLVYRSSPHQSHHSYFMCFVPLVWIGLRHGLAGTTVATLVINLGCVATLRLTDAPNSVVADFYLFEIALAAVGIGLGAAVDLRGYAETALAESQRRLAQVIAGSRLGMWDCDFELGRVSYDQAWGDMVGYGPGEVSSRLGWWETQIHTDDRARVEAVLAEHVAGRTPFYEAEFRFRHRGGGWKWIYARGSVIARDASGRALRLAGTQLDVTDRKEAETARFAAERTLLHAQKLESLEVLAGGIAHDFNNLLTVILGNVSLAQLDAAPGSAAAGHLTQARAAVLRATELCRQMLAYSGRGQFSAEMVNLNSLMADTAQLLQASVHKSVELQFALDPAPPLVRVDPTQIRQIVMNLVINASDAIGARGGTIRIATSLKTADAAWLAQDYPGSKLPPGDFVVLEVKDDGCGMTPEVKARVFEPFFTTKFTGRGLGLAAVLGIVRCYGGALKVESEPGQGSTFTLLLPAQPAKASGAVSRPAAGPPPPARHQGTILVVDDEETVRVVASRLLESQGYTTILAATGQEAVRLLTERGGEIQAALLDLTMPQMNGAQTMRELRRIRPGLPVVVMSGFSELESAERFPEASPSAMIPKPFERDVLIARIREAMGKSA